MENFSYHVPFYVVSNGVATSGHTSDLIGGQIAVFDRQNFSVATASGLAKELFFAQGAIGGIDWSGQPVTETVKSPFFFAKDVTNIYKSLPHKIQNEEWIVGYDGSASSKSIEFVAGLPTRLKLYFHGEPIYRMFNGPKEYVISYTPPVDCTSDCASTCDGPRVDPKASVMKLIDMVNNHVELKKLGVTATLVDSDFSAAATNQKQYALTIFDTGDALALAKVKAQYPTASIVRKSYSGVTSVYILTQLSTASAPSAFQYEGQSLSLQVCGACPSGWSSVAAADIYFVKRALSSSDNISDAGHQATYATAIATAYSANSGVFLTEGSNADYALVKLSFTAGTTVVGINGDIVTLEQTIPALCVAPAGGTVAWVDTGVTGLNGSRTLKIKLQRPDCAPTGDRLSDITAALTGIDGVDISSLAKVAGAGCFDEYTVNQSSSDFLQEDCLTSNVTFTYPTPLPSIDGLNWVIQDVTVTPDATRKVGIRIKAGYYDPKFGACSFDPTDYFESMPVKFEPSLLIENADNCKFAAAPTSTQTKIAKIARQSGEHVIREVIMKQDAYLQHVAQWDGNPRMREAFNMQIQNTVDRNAYYVLWYVTFGASYNATSRKGTKEKFTTIFAFKESDPNLPTFESKVIEVVSAKSDVIPHVNS